MESGSGEGLRTRGGLWRNYRGPWARYNAAIQTLPSSYSAGVRVSRRSLRGRRSRSGAYRPTLSLINASDLGSKEDGYNAVAECDRAEKNGTRGSLSRTFAPCPIGRNSHMVVTDGGKRRENLLCWKSGSEVDATRSFGAVRSLPTVARSFIVMRHWTATRICIRGDDKTTLSRESHQSSEWQHLRDRTLDVNYARPRPERQQLRPARTSDARTRDPCGRKCLSPCRGNPEAFSPNGGQSLFFAIDPVARPVWLP